MKSIKLLSLLLCLTLLTGLLAGCRTEQTAIPSAPESSMPSAEDTEATGESPVASSDSGTEAVTDPVEPQPGSLYAEAAARFAAAPNRTMEISITEERITGPETMTETRTLKAQYQDMDTATPVIRVSDLIVIDLIRAAYELLWEDGTVYAKVKEARYYSRQRLEDFLASQIPPTLLQPENYESVTAEGDLLTFSQPLSAEAWALPQEAVLQEAVGTARLNGGELAEVTYEITYLYGSSQIHDVYSVSMTPSVDEDLHLLRPETTEAYTLLGSVEAAVLLLRSRLALKAAGICSWTTTEYLLSEAVSASCYSQDTVHVYATDDTVLVGQSYAESTTIYQEDGSEKNSEYLFSLQYGDGLVTTQRTYDGEAEDPVTTDYLGGGYWSDGEELTDDEKARVRASYNKDYRDDFASDRVFSVPDYNQLKSATLMDVGEYYIIQFSATPDFEESMKQKACYDFFGEASYLDNYATAYRSKGTEGLIAFEKGTFLPTSLALSFAGVHTIYGNPFNLEMEVLTKYRICHPNTYEAISGESLPDEAPEVPPTPLFYEVTGENGEKLYLFGTVHLGDSRTGFLPQVIYDAFDSADALALEFDDEAFWERREADQALDQRVQDSYRYTDNETIQDHISPSLYYLALLRMQIAGEYQLEMEQVKAVEWARLLQGFYLDQGRSLTTSKGLEKRLGERARAQGKEILDVEDPEAHVTLLTDYSDAVQEAVLGSTVFASRKQYLDSVSKTYELWCLGDEESLAAELPDLSEEALAEMTADERAVYEEYYGTLTAQRNAPMAETAASYLESGKTVFFAVGVAHLVGADGLVEALRQAGYTVTRIDTGN
ncbi:MAG: TraB/GumN family protein [Oscillospiraceae bacterium]|nr:TraB/GumN family protein [Oscillospiraceae bacterium]